MHHVFRPEKLREKPVNLVFGNTNPCIVDTDFYKLLFHNNTDSNGAPRWGIFNGIIGNILKRKRDFFLIEHKRRDWLSWYIEVDADAMFASADRRICDNRCNCFNDIRLIESVSKPPVFDTGNIQKVVYQLNHFLVCFIAASEKLELR